MSPLAEYLPSLALSRNTILEEGESIAMMMMPSQPNTAENHIGISNLPNQLHRFCMKTPLQYNILLLGETGVGKSAFVHSLLNTLPSNQTMHEHKNENQSSKEPHTQLFHLNEAQVKNYHGHALLNAVKLESMNTSHASIQEYKTDFTEKSYQIQLSIIEAPGFGDSINENDSWTPIIKYIQHQNESYLLQELVASIPQMDNRVHLCLYFVPSYIKKLRALDIITMKRLGEVTHLLPVISKADLLTTTELEALKNSVKKDMEKYDICCYAMPVENGSPEWITKMTQIRDAMPFAIVSSIDQVDPKTRARVLPWGNVEIENEAISDFSKLRCLMIRTHLYDIMESGRLQHYEKFRSNYLEEEFENNVFDHLLFDNINELESTLQAQKETIHKNVEQLKRVELEKVHNLRREMALSEEAKQNELAQLKEIANTLKQQIDHLANETVPCA